MTIQPIIVLWKIVKYLISEIMCRIISIVANANDFMESSVGKIDI